MDADERRGRRGTLTLWAAAGLFVASAFLPGALAVGCGIIGGIALAAGLAATVFAPDPGGARQAPRPQETAIEPPAEPQPSIRLHVDPPPSVQRWLERVEAEAEAAKRSR